MNADSTKYDITVASLTNNMEEYDSIPEPKLRKPKDAWDALKLKTINRYFKESKLVDFVNNGNLKTITNKAKIEYITDL